MVPPPARGKPRETALFLADEDLEAPEATWFLPAVPDSSVFPPVEALLPPEVLPPT